MQCRLIRYSTTIFAILLLAVCGSQSLLAQTNTTALSGTVTDVTGAVVAGATVSISSAASGSKSTKVTSAKGDFSFEQVQPGTYDVQVIAQGFA
jgi:hypothetical protein